MNINLEQGGIIAQTRHQLARHGKPLDGSTGTDMYHTFLMQLVGTDVDKYIDLADKNPTIGRIATASSTSAQGRHTTTRLALIGELVGALPDYYPDRPGVKEIGKVSLHAYDLHKHDDQTLISSSVSYTADILTTGEVVLAPLEMNTCERCTVVDLSQDIQLLGKLGVASLYHTSEQFVDFRARRTDYGHLYDHPLDTDQLVKLQRYLLDILPLDTL